MGENLPDLKSRIILDDSTAEAKVLNLVGRVKALGQTATTSGKGAFGEIEKGASKTVGVVEKVGSALGNMSSKSVTAARNLESGVFGPAGALASGIPIVGGLLLGVTGLFAALDHVTNKTSEYGAMVLRNSTLLGMNTQQYQGLAYAVGKFGMDQTALTQVMLRFDRNLEDGAPALKAMGLDLKTIGVNSNDSGTALNQLSSYLQKNTNEMQRNAVAVAVLGRGGTAMIQVLSKGPGFLKQYTDYLTRMGVILDGDQLKTAAVARTIDDQFHTALQGLETQVGVQLEGAFSRLYLSILQAFGNDPKKMFDAIGKAIANVLNWVLSLIDGIFGLKLTLASMVGTLDPAAEKMNAMANTTQTASDSFDGSAQSAKASADALDKLRNSTQDQTQALDDQIKVLDNQYTALESQFKMQDLLQQQQDDMHQSYLSQLQDQLAQLNQTNQSRRQSGETVLDYERRMSTEKLQTEISHEESRRKTLKDAHDLQLEQLKETTDKTKQSLENQKQALQNYLQDAERRQAKYASDANALQDGMATRTGKDMALQKGDMDSFFKDITKGSDQSATDFGKNIRKMIGDIGDLLGAIANVVKAVNAMIGLVSSGVSGAAFLGAQVSGNADQLVSTSIGQILQSNSLDQINQIGNAAANTGLLNDDEARSIHDASALRAGILNGVPRAQLQQYIDDLKGMGWVLQGYAKGGDPPVGVPYVTGENGPEIHVDKQPGTIIPLDKMGNHFEANFYGPVADQYVADRITQRWANKQHNQAHQLAAGIG